MTVDERIGTNVHQMLWERHLKQTALMQSMGVSRSSLAKKLRGEVVWMARDIEAAALTLDVDPGRLFADARAGQSNPVTRQYQDAYRAPVLQMVAAWSDSRNDVEEAA